MAMEQYSESEKNIQRKSEFSKAKENTLNLSYEKQKQNLVTRRSFFRGLINIRTISLHIRTHFCFIVHIHLIHIHTLPIET